MENKEIFHNLNIPFIIMSFFQCYLNSKSNVNQLYYSKLIEFIVIKKEKEKVMLNEW